MRFACLWSIIPEKGTKIGLISVTKKEKNAEHEKDKENFF